LLRRQTLGAVPMRTLRVMARRYKSGLFHMELHALMEC